MVVRADPRLTPLELVNPPQTNSLSVQQVADRYDFKVVINAAMFATDYVTSVGYMRNFDYVNNPKISTRYGGFIFFNPKKPSSPAVLIGPQSEMQNYHTVFQTYRMWSAKEGILWKKGKSIFYQVALVGVDGKNRVLFFFHPRLVDVHDLVGQILGLNLDLKGLLYLDGGNHGALYLAPELGREWNTRLFLPNLLGLKAAD